MRTTVTILLAVTAALLGAADPPAAVTVAWDGTGTAMVAGRPALRIAAGRLDGDGAWAEATPDWRADAGPDTRSFTVAVPGPERRPGSVRWAADGSASWTFPASTAGRRGGVAIELDATAYAGGRWAADGAGGGLPGEGGALGARCELVDALGRTLAVAVAEGGPAALLPAAAGRPMRIQVPASDAGTVRLSIGPATLALEPTLAIQAGRAWIPFTGSQEVEAGSALDFSGLGLQDAPAGRHGAVIVRPDGHLAYAGSPAVARRFYGANLCGTAQYLARPAIEAVADRFVRMGYNAVRIHHHEKELVQGRPTSLEIDPARLDQLDALAAAMIRRGIYLTTDLYVSRPVPARELGLEGDGPAELKLLAPVLPAARENIKAFARAFLGHVNPYTGRSWAAEPALAWLSLVNEGNLGNSWDKVVTLRQWTEAWNAWLAARHPDRASLAAAWPGGLGDAEDPARGTVALPSQLAQDGPRARDAQVFVAERQRALFADLAGFVRGELGYRGLLTNTNGWTNHYPDQLVRQDYDYVDDHFYVDHPMFPHPGWGTPSRLGNRNPALQGAPGGRGSAFLRMAGKPFAISEYNYCWPGGYRGAGGLLTGALGALQGWDAVWRFDYATTAEAMGRMGSSGYFHLGDDPANLAAERAAVLLFLRGDLREAPGRLVIHATPDELSSPAFSAPGIWPDWTWAAWITRIAWRVGPAPEGADAAVHLDAATHGLPPAQVVAALRRAGIPAPDAPAAGAPPVLVSETGQVRIDGERGVFAIDTPCTAGGYVLPGAPVRTAVAEFACAEGSPGAAVWASSLDGRPVGRSGRILVSHVPDIQNSGTVFSGDDRSVLLRSGGLPHLVRVAGVRCSLIHEAPGRLQVHALDTAGHRLGLVPAEAAGGRLVFTAGTATPFGPCLAYEVVAGP